MPRGLILRGISFLIYNMYKSSIPIERQLKQRGPERKVFIVEPKDLKPFVEALDAVGLQDCCIVERLVSFVASR